MKQLWKILGYFGVGAATVTTLFGIFKYLDNISDKVDNVQEMVDYNNIQINDVSGQLYDLQDTAKDIQKEQERQGNRLNNLTWIFQHRNEYTEEQLQELIEMMMERGTVTSPSHEYHGEIEFVPIDTLIP